MKFKNWVKKIWCTLADIDGISWGNCTKLSYLMCPLWGIKCPHLILGVLLPKNFGGKKRSFQLRSTTPFCDFNADISRLEQDIVDRKRGCILQSLLMCLPNLVNFGPQTAKWDRPFSSHSKSTFSDAHISGAKRRCLLKISHLVKDDH